MAIKAPESNNSTLKAPQLEDGSYEGFLIGVIDLGVMYPSVWDTSQNKFVPNTEKKPVRHIYVQFDLADEFMVDEDGNVLEDKPRRFGKKIPLYPLSSDQATSTKWTKALDPTNQHKGDWGAMLKSPCTLMIKATNNGKNKLGNIGAITQKKASKLGEPVNEYFLFDADNPDMEIYEKLPQFIKDDIVNAISFSGSKLEQILGGATSKEEAPEVETEDDDEDTVW